MAGTKTILDKITQKASALANGFIKKDPLDEVMQMLVELVNIGIHQLNDETLKPINNYKCLEKFTIVPKNENQKNLLTLVEYSRAIAYEIRINITLASEILQLNNTIEIMASTEPSINNILLISPSTTLEELTSLTTLLENQVNIISNLNNEAPAYDKKLLSVKNYLINLGKYEKQQESVLRYEAEKYQLLLQKTEKIKEYLLSEKENLEHYHGKLLESLKNLQATNDLFIEINSEQGKKIAKNIKIYHNSLAIIKSHASFLSRKLQDGLIHVIQQKVLALLPIYTNQYEAYKNKMEDEIALFSKSIAVIYEKRKLIEKMLVQYDEKIINIQMSYTNQVKNFKKSLRNTIEINQLKAENQLEQWPSQKIINTSESEKIVYCSVTKNNPDIFYTGLKCLIIFLAIITIMPAIVYFVIKLIKALKEKILPEKPNSESRENEFNNSYNPTLLVIKKNSLFEMKQANHNNQRHEIEHDIEIIEQEIHEIEELLNNNVQQHHSSNFRPNIARQSTTFFP